MSSLKRVQRGASSTASWPSAAQIVAANRSIGPTGSVLVRRSTSRARSGFPLDESWRGFGCVRTAAGGRERSVAEAEAEAVAVHGRCGRNCGTPHRRFAEAVCSACVSNPARAHRWKRQKRSAPDGWSGFRFCRLETEFSKLVFSRKGGIRARFTAGPAGTAVHQRPQWPRSTRLSNMSKKRSRSPSLPAPEGPCLAHISNPSPSSCRACWWDANLASLALRSKTRCVACAHSPCPLTSSQPRPTHAPHAPHPPLHTHLSIRLLPYLLLRSHTLSLSALPLSLHPSL